MCYRGYRWESPWLWPVLSASSVHGHGAAAGVPRHLVHMAGRKSGGRCRRVGMVGPGPGRREGSSWCRWWWLDIWPDLFIEWARHPENHHPTPKSLGWQQRQGWALIRGGMGSRRVRGPSWCWGGVTSILLRPAHCPIRAVWKMNAHALQWLDGAVMWTTVVPHPWTLRRTHLSPCHTHSPAVDTAGFVIMPNLEMKTLKLRELTGLAHLPLASQCQGSEGNLTSSIFVSSGARSLWASSLYLPLFFTTRPGLPPSKLLFNQMSFVSLNTFKCFSLSQESSCLDNVFLTEYTSGCWWSVYFPFPFSRKIKDVKSLCRKETFHVWPGKGSLSLGSFGLWAIENPSDKGLNIKTKQNKTPLL